MLITIEDWKEWRLKQEAIHDYLIELGEIESFSVQEQKKVNGFWELCFDFYANLYCQYAPVASFWLEVESEDGDELFIVEVRDRVPQYSSPSTLTKQSSCEFQKSVVIVEE